MNEMDEIKITETVYKQSVAIRGIQNTNKQRRVRLPHLPPPPQQPRPQGFSLKREKPWGRGCPPNTHTNSTFDIFENTTVTFEWSSLGICMLRAERLGTAFYGVFPDLLGELTPLTYPRRLDHETRDALAAWSARNNRV